MDLPSHLPGEAPDTEEVVAPVEVVETEVIQPQEDVEDEEKPGSGPVTISGTNIVLATEEDIAQWIAERRKKWPTKKNIELRTQQQKSAKLEKKRPAPDQNTLSASKRSKPLCRYFLANGTCRFGAKCKNVHEQARVTDTYYTKDINGVAVKIPKVYSNRAGTAFTDLLVQQHHIEHENGKVIDFVKKLDEWGYIDKAVRPQE